MIKPCGGRPIGDLMMMMWPGFHVLGCRVDILGTNCTKLLKVKMSGGGGGVALASVRVSVSGGAARRLLLDKKYILSSGVHFTAVKKRR